MALVPCPLCRKKKYVVHNANCWECEGKAVVPGNNGEICKCLMDRCENGQVHYSIRCPECKGNGFVVV